MHSIIRRTGRPAKCSTTHNHFQGVPPVVSDGGIPMLCGKFNCCRLTCRRPDLPVAGQDHLDIAARVGLRLRQWRRTRPAGRPQPRIDERALDVKVQALAGVVWGVN